MANDNPTGLKQIFQSMIPDGNGVIEGFVTEANPLKVTLANDSKMILTANSLIVPRHLTDYMVEVDIEKVDGELVSETTEGGGRHVNELSTFSLSSGMLHVHNALKNGDTVYLLQFNGGKKYYILDRKG